MRVSPTPNPNERRSFCLAREKTLAVRTLTLGMMLAFSGGVFCAWQATRPVPASDTAVNPGLPDTPASTASQGSPVIVPGQVIESSRLPLLTPPPPPPPGSPQSRLAPPPSTLTPMVPGNARQAQAGLATAPDPALGVAENLTRMAGTKTFSGLAQDSGLMKTLAGDGPYTVFVPDDTAFKRLPDGAVNALSQPAQKPNLLALLSYHVVQSRIARATFEGVENAHEALKLKTLNGGVLELTPGPGGSWQLRDAHGSLVEIAREPIESKNGTIFVVNGLFMP